MKRALLASLLMALLSSPAALAQRANIPVSIDADIDAMALGIVDHVRLWPMEWTGDTSPDFIAQVGVVLGGNAVGYQYFIYGAEPDGQFLRVGDFSLPGAGIETVRQSGGTVEMIVYTYLPGDARCCPNGRETVRLARP